MTLGEVYKQVLTKAGYTVTTQKVGLRNILEPALARSGQINVVPEYAASLTQFLLDKDKDTSQSASTDINKTMDRAQAACAQAQVHRARPGWLPPTRTPTPSPRRALTPTG